MSAMKSARMAAFWSGVRHAENRRRVVRRDGLAAGVGGDPLAAVFRDAEMLPDQRLGGRRAETDDRVGLDKFDFLLDPGPARRDLAGTGLFVDSPAAARLELEVFDRVRDVGLTAVDAGLAQHLVKQLARGPDERAAGEVFLVARLLADEDHAGVRGPLAEDDLGGVFVQVAALAEAGGGRSLGEVAGLGGRSRRP